MENNANLKSYGLVQNKKDDKAGLGLGRGYILTNCNLSINVKGTSGTGYMMEQWPGKATMRIQLSDLSGDMVTYCVGLYTDIQT